MKKILEKEHYAITCEASEGTEKRDTMELSEVFINVAKKEGLRLEGGATWGGADIVEIVPGEDVPFEDFQAIMDAFSLVTRHSLFLSSDKDIEGKKIMAYSKKEAANAVRKEAILISRPPVKQK